MATSGNMHPGCKSPTGCVYSTYCQRTDELDSLIRNATIVKETYERLIRDMSNALWCDKGEHAFSPKDMDRQEMKRITRDKDGTEYEETFSICGKHASEVGLTPPSDVKAIDAVPVVAAVGFGLIGKRVSSKTYGSGTVTDYDKHDDDYRVEFEDTSLWLTADRFTVTP